jgi:hypothetical protein
VGRWVRGDRTRGFAGDVGKGGRRPSHGAREGEGAQRLAVSPL